MLNRRTFLTAVPAVGLLSILDADSTAIDSGVVRGLRRCEFVDFVGSVSFLDERDAAGAEKFVRSAWPLFVRKFPWLVRDFKLLAVDLTESSPRSWIVRMLFRRRRLGTPAAPSVRRPPC